MSKELNYVVVIALVSVFILSSLISIVASNSVLFCSNIGYDFVSGTHFIEAVIVGYLERRDFQVSVV